MFNLENNALNLSAVKMKVIEYEEKKQQLCLLYQHNQAVFFLSL